MAKSLIDIFNSSDKVAQINTKNSQTPLSDSKISEKELEEARNGAISTKKYSDTPKG